MAPDSTDTVFTALDAEIAALSTPEARLGAIGAFVRRCLLCDLHDRRRLAVPGEGSPDGGLCIIGEGPGRSEDEAGRPFVGPAGRLLEDFLEQAGLNRAEIFITNIVKCRPADRIDDKLQNRRPLGWEVKTCHPYLERQLDIIRPRIILCLGNSAARGMLGGRFGMKKYRGRFFPGPGGSRIIATYHPAFAGRWAIPGLAPAELRHMVVADMNKAREALA